MSELKELNLQLDELNRKIQVVREKEIADAVAKVRAIIADYGLTELDVFGKARKPVSERKPVEVKYRDPETGQTWTGRGRAPVWIAGKDRAAFSIYK